MDLSSLLVVVAFTIPILICLMRILHNIRMHKKIRLRSFSLKNRWVMDSIYNYSVKCAKESYMQMKNHGNLFLYTFSQEYKDSVVNYNSYIFSYISDGYEILDFFKDFIHAYYPLARRYELGDIIGDYINRMNQPVFSQEEGFLNGSYEVTPSDFFQIRKKQVNDIVGVYVIYNYTKNMPYVGQAKRLLFRLNQHFTGHGNGDIYADYKYGDYMLIRLIPLYTSGCGDLDLLEKSTIKYFDSYNHGYNRTSGNGN